MGNKAVSNGVHQPPPSLPLSQVRTYFNADEFWQSVEIAHALVFGYGHYTWEWTAALRGYTHPLLFAAPYWVLRVAGLDTPTTLVLVPRVLQVRSGFVFSGFYS